MISTPLKTWLNVRRSRAKESPNGGIQRVSELDEARKPSEEPQSSLNGRLRGDALTPPRRQLDPGYVQCRRCKRPVFGRDLEERFGVCPSCDHHHQIGASARIRLLIDPGAFEEHDAELCSQDPLGFDGYTARLDQAFASTSQRSAIVSGLGRIGGKEVAVAIVDFRFVGGSMGSVVGEKTARTIETAKDLDIPLLTICASGGARMFEGIYSLMQMAKTTITLSEFLKGGRPYISVLTDPTYGGVTASFATAADVILAEPGARVGFAGPRVIEQTTREVLPDGFQTAEFQRERGMVDRIVHRHRMRSELKDLLKLLA